RARAQPGGCAVGGAHAAVLEIGHAAALPESQPRTPSLRVGEQHRGVVMTSKHRPGEPLDESAVTQVQETSLRREPEVARVIAGNAVDLPAGDAGYGDVPPPPEVAEPAVREYLDPPGMILKQRLHGIIGKTACPKIGLHLAVAPSGQTVMGTYPHAPVRGREHRTGDIARQSLSPGEGADRQLPKA